MAHHRNNRARSTRGESFGGLSSAARRQALENSIAEDDAAYRAQRAEAARAAAEHRHAPLRQRSAVGHPGASLNDITRGTPERFECLCSTVIVGRSIVACPPRISNLRKRWVRDFVAYCDHCGVLLRATFLHDDRTGRTSNQQLAHHRLKGPCVEIFLRDHPEASAVSE